MKKFALALIGLLVLSVGCFIGGIAFCDWANNASTVRSNPTTSVLTERGR
jgi:hypothetical protein